MRFGLVAFQVEAVNALQREHGKVELHQLHATCHSRIRYDKQCPLHGHVDTSEIVSGYEYARGKYLEIEPEELDKLHSESERALSIDAFVTPDEIDPIYFDGRMYYLLPKGAEALEPYAIFQGAMHAHQRYGVGQVVFSGREQLALVRPIGSVLAMAMLNYPAEIRSPEEFAPEAGQVRLTPKKLELAETLIKTWSDQKFDFSKYQDSYFNRLEHLIDAKIEGKEVVAPPTEEEPQVLNLMDALKKSVAHLKASGKGSATKSASPSKHALAKRTAGKKGHAKHKQAS